MLSRNTGQSIKGLQNGQDKSRCQFAADGGDGQVGTVAAPVNASEALEMVRAGMGFLAAADASAMPASVQAQCLQGLEEIDSIETVARASVLRAFSAGQGYCDDGEFSARTWLVHRTRTSRGAAAGHMRWARRAVAHPVVAAALGEAVVSQSWARVICEQTGRLPAGSRDEARGLVFLLHGRAVGLYLEEPAVPGRHGLRGRRRRLRP
jgi:hypothetical protein